MKPHTKAKVKGMDNCPACGKPIIDPSHPGVISLCEIKSCQPDEDEDEDEDEEREVAP